MARQRLLILTMYVEVEAQVWVIRDYLPETVQAHCQGFPAISWFARRLPRVTVQAIAVPRECRDGFMVAFWGRPEAYLDARIRTATSTWHQVPPEAATRALAQLQDDLASGEWDRRYGRLREQSELDVGLRLVSSDLG